MFNFLNYWQDKKTDTFFQARYRLTRWYVFILGLLIVIFTYMVFQAKESAFVRVYTVVSSYNQEQKKLVELKDTYEEFNQRFKQRVLFFDGVLLLVAAAGAWWLSGKTLSPIQTMMEEQASFAGDVSHGLRTPLTSMQLQLEAYRRTQKKMPNKMASLVNDFTQELTHMTRIVEGVLALSRSANRSLTRAEETQINLNELLTRAYTNTKPLAEAKKHTLELKLSKKTVTVWGNADQILQVIIVLIDNAIKYTPEGGTIGMSLKPGLKQAIISVTDSGEGIPKKEQKKIFETYYRGKQKTKIKGAGLGLAIAHKIVTQNGGSITVTHHQPKGACFRVKLPCGKALRA